MLGWGILAESCLARLGDVGFLFWTDRHPRQVGSAPDDLPRHQATAAKPEARQCKWSLVTWAGGILIKFWTQVWVQPLIRNM